MDVCESPSGSTGGSNSSGGGSSDSSGSSCHGSNIWSYCSSSCPCKAGEVGDCDSDNDCVGARCVDNVGAKYNQASTMDICE